MLPFPVRIIIKSALVVWLLYQLADMLLKMQSAITALLTKYPIGCILLVEAQMQIAITTRERVCGRWGDFTKQVVPLETAVQMIEADTAVRRQASEKKKHLFEVVKRGYVTVIDWSGTLSELYDIRSRLTPSAQEFIWSKSTDQMNVNIR